MAASKKTSRTLLLKEVIIYPKESLDSTFILIRKCLNHFELKGKGYPVMKLRSVNQEICFHNIDNSDKYIFGELTLSQPGKNHEAIVDKEDDKLHVETKKKISISAKSAANNKTAEFNEGSLWFLCDENYIIVLQSSKFRSSKFEKYLTHIFHKCDLIKKEETCLMKNGMSPSMQKLLLNDHVKEIFVSDNLECSDVTGMDTNTRYITTMIKSDDIKSSVSDINNIVFEVKLKLPKSKMEFSQEVFDMMSLSLKDLSYNKMWIELRNHGKIKGNEFFATHDCKIKANDGVLRTSSVKSEMISWYDEIVSEI